MSFKCQIHVDRSYKQLALLNFRTYYKGVAAAMIVYDVTQRATFREVESWVQDCLLQCEPNTTMLLLGNKCDIADKRQVSTEVSLLTTS